MKRMGKRMGFRLLSVVFLSLFSLFGCDGGGGGGGTTAPTLVSIVITPINPSIAVGQTQQFTATGAYSDGSTQNLMTSVTWSSSAVSVATISSAGLATAIAVGSTTITATSGGISGNTTLTVTGAVKLHKTGQTICYDARGNVITCADTGQDGDLQKGVAWPSPRFTVGTGAEADCVTDNLTGLMWVKSPDSVDRNWAGAISHANGLSICGHDDWRLPNINELESLIHAGEVNTATWLNTQGFNNVQNVRPARYWSSSTCADKDRYAWVVDMSGGDVYDYEKLSSSYVHAWPVRAGQ